MTDSVVRYEVQDGVATITLNRPAMLNALDLALTAALADAAERAAADPAVWVVVVRGAGRAFSSGMDRKALSAGQVSEASYRNWVRALNCLEDMPKLSVAVLHGYSIGGGLTRAVASHLRPPARHSPNARRAPDRRRRHHRARRHPARPRPRRLDPAPGAADRPGSREGADPPERSRHSGGGPRDGAGELGGARGAAGCGAGQHRHEGVSRLADRHRPRQAPAPRLIPRGSARLHRGRAARPGRMHGVVGDPGGQPRVGRKARGALLSAARPPGSLMAAEYILETEGLTKIGSA